MQKEIKKLLDCSKCKLKECIGCEITYNDRKKIREYIEGLEGKEKILIDFIDFSVKATGNSDEYSTGMCNGMICIKSVITGEEPKYMEVLKGEKEV